MISTLSAKEETGESPISCGLVLVLGTPYVADVAGVTDVTAWK